MYSFNILTILFIYFFTFNNNLHKFFFVHMLYYNIAKHNDILWHAALLPPFILAAMLPHSFTVNKVNYSSSAV
jgi:hypothetical protein